MKTFIDLISEVRKEVNEIFPWDLSDWLEEKRDVVLLDIREPYEVDAMRLENSIAVPRGVLETAVEWGYEETVPELVQAREKEVVVMCRSGNRSLFAAKLLQDMGFHHVFSLKTGIRGWNDDEQPLIKEKDTVVDIDDADEYFAPDVSDEQMDPMRKF
jgi:rhodanese-related sulfurtransferase